MNLQRTNDKSILPGAGSIVHVVGIAGVGMNAVAQLLQARGYRVTGSDRLKDQRAPSSPVLDVLERGGIRIFPQDGSGITPETGAVVISSAIEPDNPDLESARTHEVPGYHRAEALAAVIGDDRCIAVAGTSGKTTVTGMVGWVLAEAGLDPNVVNGGAVLNWKTKDRVGNVRMGASDLWVVEVDESDRSLLQFHPEWALITNISRDHFDLKETVDLFGGFAEQVTRGLICGQGVHRHLAGMKKIKAPQWDAPADTGRLLVPSLPGKHNQENALLACALCEQLGLSRAEAAQALARFKGIERRLERVGTCRDVTVYDDYAHNPAKIHAAWSAVSEKAERVLGMWRPHGFGPLAAMADDLVAMFRDTCRSGDRLYMLPVYYAGGTANKAVTSDMLVDRLRAADVPACAVAGYDELANLLLRESRAGDVVLCMGARDPQLPIFARDLVSRLAAD